MQHAIEALEWSTSSWQKEVDDCAKDIQRQRDTLADAQSRIANLEKRQSHAQEALDDLAEGIRILKAHVRTP